jgi:hypothetical protein
MGSYCYMKLQDFVILVHMLSVVCQFSFILSLAHDYKPKYSNRCCYRTKGWTSEAFWFDSLQMQKKYPLVFPL